MAHQSIGTDMFLEILSRCSLQTVGRCRAVSKECNSLTYESQFMHLSSQRNRTISGYFLQYMRYNRYSSEFVHDPNASSTLSLDFLPGPVKILACTNQGFLLCENLMPKNYRIPEYYVCKPTTKEWQQIPNPKTRYITQGVAMMVLRSNPLRYKIIRLTDTSRFQNFNRKHAHEYSFRCEIFDSNAWAWKQLEEIYLPYHKRLISQMPAISVCGAIHWLTRENNIWAFNVDDETWRLLLLPNGINDETYYLQLANYEGKLALVRELTEKEEDCGFELWVMQDYYGKMLWEKRHRVSVKPLQRAKWYIAPLPRGIYNADIALMVGCYKVYFHNFKNGSFDAVESKYIVDRCGVFQFQSDFEPSHMRVIRGTNEFARREIFIRCLKFASRGAVNPIFMFIFWLVDFILMVFIWLWLIKGCWRFIQVL